MISFKTKIIFLISLFYGIVSAECSNQIGQTFGGADQDFCIQEEYFNENRIVSFYVSSFDFNTGETDIDFFRYRIMKNYDQSLDDTFITGNLILDYTISVYSPQLGFHSKQDIFEGKLKVIGVNRDVVVHNSDFSIYTDRINGFPVIPQINSFPSQTVMDNMLSTIMQTGKLPDGTYSFTVELAKEVNGQLEVMDKIERSIEVYSPVFLELVTPGGNLSDTTDTKIFSTYPVFQWVTDYCPDCNYGIRVCEFSPDKHSSISEAIDDYNRSIAVAPRYALAYLNRGEAHLAFARVSEALDDFNKGITLDPTYAKGYLFRAQLNRTLGNTEKALRDYDKLVALDPQNSTYRLKRAYFLHKINKLNLAMNDLNAIINAGIDTAEAFNERGIIQGKLGNQKAAMDDFTAAINANPLHKMAYRNRAMGYLRSGFYSNAENDLNRVLAIDPSDKTTYEKFVGLFLI